MRTQMRYAGLGVAGLLGLAAAAALGGCEDVTTGHPTDPSGFVQLVRVMVQDSPASVMIITGAGGTTRGGAVDLLDDAAPVACNDTNPCQVFASYEKAVADFTCRNAVCNDPLKPSPIGVPINPDIAAVPATPAMPPMPAMGCTPASPGTPATPASDAVAGVSIRLVFNKLLDASKITSDGITLLPGVVDFVDDASGQPFPFDQLGAIWDPSGDPAYTADPLVSPFGPAIQISPLGLLHSSRYHVVLHPGLIHDRNGNAVADHHGSHLSGDTSFAFTTEDVSANISIGSFSGESPTQLPGDFTPVFTSPVTPPAMFTSDVLRLAFWSNVDLDSFDFTMIGPNGEMLTTVEKYFDSPKDPGTKTCPAANASTTQIDLANTSAPGTPAPWPAGRYKLRFTVKSPDPNTSMFSSTKWPGADADGNLTFDVVEAPSNNSPATDPSIIDLHPLPEQMCPCL